MKNFQFYEPESIEQACDLLEKFKGRASTLAGGTDLLVELKAGRIKPAAVVNLKKIKGLNKITFSLKEGLSIGALVTWTQILDSKPVSRHYPLLTKAAETLGSVQIRNVATLAGNICHASPAANGPIPLLTYDAECVIRGLNGGRVIPVEKLFRGPQKNSLRRGEILTEIRIPLPPKRAHGVYYKFGFRKAMELAIVGVGVIAKTNNGNFDHIRIVLGSVAPKPFRARRAEKVLAGKAVDDQRIHKAAETAADECNPITDVRASKEYRMELLKELAFRAIKESIV